MYSILMLHFTTNSTYKVSNKKIKTVVHHSSPADVGVDTVRHTEAIHTRNRNSETSPYTRTRYSGPPTTGRMSSPSKTKGELGPTQHLTPKSQPSKSRPTYGGNVLGEMSSEGLDSNDSEKTDLNMQRGEHDDDRNDAVLSTDHEHSHGSGIDMSISEGESPSAQGEFSADSHIHEPQHSSDPHHVVSETTQTVLEETTKNVKRKSRRVKYELDKSGWLTPSKWGDKSIDSHANVDESMFGMFQQGNPAESADDVDVEAVTVQPPNPRLDKQPVTSTGKVTRMASVFQPGWTMFASPRPRPTEEIITESEGGSEVSAIALGTPFEVRARTLQDAFSLHGAENHQQNIGSVSLKFRTHFYSLME